MNLFLILFLALLLRFHQLTERFVWSLDQSLAIWPIIKLFEEKKLTLIGVHFMNPKSALFRPPFFTYLFALPWKLVDFSPLALEAIFALIGVMVAGVIYLIAKNIFNHKIGLTAAFLYAINPVLIDIDKRIHTITPVIITSTLAYFILAKYFQAQKKRYLFLIGLILSLGMSFHFQIFVPLLALVVYLAVDKNKYKIKLARIGVLLIGFAVFLLPLLVFNLRHDLIMLKGFQRTFFTQEVVYSQSKGIKDRVQNSLQPFADLGFDFMANNQVIAPLRQKPLLFFFLGIILPGLIIQLKRKGKRVKFFLRFYWITIFIGLVSLMFVNQGYYGKTAFYLWFFTPLLVIIWARLINLLIASKKLSILGWLILVFFTFNCLFSWFNYPPNNSYQEKMRLINHIFEQKPDSDFGVKFIGIDALAYDYLFHYQGRKKGFDYSQFRLLEEWDQGKTDFIIIHGDYDFEKDIYQVKPYWKIIEFGGANLVIKNSPATSNPIPLNIP